MRIERKHCVPDDIADVVLGIAQEFLSAEPRSPRRAQQVTSLYLDTPSLTFLQWHVDRSPARFKLRVRAYGDAPYPNVYVEVKQKDGVVSQKRRAAVRATALCAVLNGVCLSECRAAVEEADALDEFVWRTIRYGATPKVLTRSVRESWRAEDETAVTADRFVAFRRAYGRDALYARDGWRRMPLPQHAGMATTILELKHGAQPPLWMADIARRLTPWRTSFSKYATAMAHLAPWERC